MAGPRLAWITRLLLIAALILTQFTFSPHLQAQDPQPAAGGHPLYLPVLNGSSSSVRSAPIYLGTATLSGDSLQAASTPPGLTISGYAQGQRGYYIVQFVGPVLQSWKDTVAGEGAELLDYLPDYAFKVRMNPAQATRVSALPSVAFVGIFQPAYKLSPALKREGTNLYRVRVERGADAGLTTAAIAQSGAQILGQSDGILLIGADAAQVDAIANVLDVAWVENFVLPEKHNEIGAGVIMGANAANNRGYDGTGQIVAVADTGLGNGTAAGAHADIPASRVVAINNWPGQTDQCFKTIQDDGAIDVDSAHGTHVSVSVLGDGYGTTSLGRGTAPAANLVFQATENWVVTSRYCQLFGITSGYYLTGLPNDLNSLYQQAYNQGARVHANSWGSSQAGLYTANSAQTDQFIWNNPDMAITFSAGNDGADTVDPFGVVDNDSIGSPATAKNVITVGASENARLDNFPCDTVLTYPSSDSYQQAKTCGGVGGMGGKNLLGTAGSRWGFTSEPLNSDPTAGNAQQMAPFSSRGPTDDGRIKPDVVAPGTWILSGYSSLYQQGYGSTATNPENGAFQWDGWGMPLNSQYKYMGGTSMSNPLVAGAAAVVRSYYALAHAHNASAALVKATLINSAVDLLDENNDGADDNDFPIPNVHEGWGRVDIDNATDSTAQFVDATPGLTTGNSASYQYSVPAGSPFKVTLVWSDYPSSETAAINLVNNLDLLVIGPGGAQYRGNFFSGGWSQTGGSADNINNVENVYIQSAAAGSWKVEVIGVNVPNGPQPYALVVDGAHQSTVDTPPTVSISSPINGSTVSGTVAVTALASDDNPVPQVEFFVDSTTSIGIDTDGTDGWSVSWDTTTASDSNHTISATATDTINQTGSSSISVTVNNAPPPSGVHVGDLDGSATAGSKGQWTPTVNITIHDSGHQPVSGATVSGSWSSGESGSCITGANGQCTITALSSIKGGSVNFDVTDVTNSLTYQRLDNHDPDGDSNGTTIVIFKP